MTSRTRFNLSLAISAFVISVVLAILLIREPMEPLSSEALQLAQQRWHDARVHHYDVRYRMHGSMYEIKVRDRIVTQAKVDGQAPRTADLKAYSMDGLFEILELELANINDPRGPFSASAQAILARVRFNDKLGYVERYLRSSGGSGRGAVIELIDFARRN